MNPALRSEFRQQRRTVFGHGRYWFHIVLWLIVVTFSYPYTEEFSRGMMIGIDIASSNNKDSLKNIRPDSLAIKLNEVKAAEAAGQATKPRGKQPQLLADAAWSIFAAAILIYSFLLLAIPYARYRQQKRYLYISFFLIALLFVGALVTGSIYMDVQATKAGSKIDRQQFLPFLHLLLSCMLVFIVTVSFFALYYFIDLYDQQKALDRYGEVFSAKMLAETSFLKMQINPHFLFNSLNNIYALTLNQSPQAPVVAGRLRELVSYMLNECSQELVPVSGELKFLTNYIALEQLRNQQEQVIISCEVRGNTEGLLIAPLLLVNFIENAFKHGVKAGIDRAEVRVRVDLVGRMLSMEVFNTKPAVVEGPAQAIREAGGIGIRNVRRRLQILYPDRHVLRINDAKASYSVHLNVTL